MSLIFEDDAEMESGEVEAVFDWLERMSNAERVASAVKLAAKFMEFGAYELARSDSANQVAKMIQMAADMERMSKSLEKIVEIPQ